MGRPNSKTFPAGTVNKTFLTSTTAMDTQQMSKIQSRLAIKPKIIQSLSACKNHSVNLLYSSNLLWHTPDFRVPWSKRSRTFWSMPSQWLLYWYLAFLNLYQHTNLGMLNINIQKIRSSIHSWDIADFRDPWPKRLCS